MCVISWLPCYYSAPPPRNRGPVPDMTSITFTEGCFAFVAAKEISHYCILAGRLLAQMTNQTASFSDLFTGTSVLLLLSDTFFSSKTEGDESDAIQKLEAPLLPPSR